MSVLPNLRNSATAGQPFAYIDVPDFPYDQWLQSLNGAPLGTIPSTQTVAIIGGGMSGLCAGYELSRVQGCQVMVFEASGDVGGRSSSRTFPAEPNGPDIAEMGSMRFPPSEFILNYYLVKFGLVPNGLSSLNDFPDPGVNQTYVCYGNGTNPNDPDPPPQVQTWVKPSPQWPNGTKFPKGFKTVYDGWVALCSKGLTPTGNQPALLGAYQIQTLLQALNYGQATKEWQKYLNVFGQDTFYSALYKIFTGNSGYQIPNGTAWTFADFDKFGALGLGSGGFGPLYPIGFCEIMRIVIDGLEDHQKFLAPNKTSMPDGIRTLATTFAGGIGNYPLPVLPPTSPNAVVTNTPIVGITGSVGNFTLIDASGNHYPGFARVIVATTTRVMELMLGLTEYNNGFVSAPVARAIMRTHIVSSNKVAVRISNFWSGNSGAIRCLQTDGTAHQIYTLNYGTGANGCCFMTYVWDDDAVKQQSITGGIPSNPADNETLCKFLYNSVKSIDSGVANWVQQYLQPVDGDWKNNVIFEEWQSQPYFGGAFKLSEPGQDQYVSDMFWDFQKANAVGVAPDTGVYIAGDCISWTSGWVEGALTTGLNAAAAVITSLGGKVTANRNNSQSPMTISSRYNYLA